MTAPPQLRELAIRLEQLRRRRNEAPLTIHRLWTHPAADCDQRRQVLLSLRSSLHVAMGGNRSGKSYGEWGADVAVALGRDHPHTAAWCRLNDIDPELIPLGPGEVIVASQTSSTSRSQARPAIGALLPAGSAWYGRNGLAEAYVTIPCPGYHREARIWFKSIDQGPRGFKGSEARRYHIDEEPEGEDGRLVLEECLRGASSVGGRTVITATPQAGLTWMVEDLVSGGKYGAVTTRLNSLHNRFARDYDGLVGWLRTLEPAERLMREQGVWVDRRGVIYTGWMRHLHYVDSVQLDGLTVTADSIPKSWIRYRAFDFGQSTGRRGSPTAVLWVAEQPVTGRLLVYRAMEAKGVPYQEWAALVHEAEGAVQDDDGVWVGHAESIELCWGDPSDPGAIEALCLGDVPTVGAHRSWGAGVSDVRHAMALDAAGVPGLVVLRGRGTDGVVRSIEGLRYDPSAKVAKQLKRDDHLADALRYCVHGIRRLAAHAIR